MKEANESRCFGEKLIEILKGAHLESGALKAEEGSGRTFQAEG